MSLIDKDQVAAHKRWEVQKKAKQRNKIARKILAVMMQSREHHTNIEDAVAKAFVAADKFIEWESRYAPRT